MNVSRLLHEWAKWVMAESEGRIDYPSRTPFNRMTGGGLPSSLLSNDEAEDICTAMAWMARHKPMLSDVLERHYIQRQSVSKIARERKEDRRMVAGALFAGETAVEVYLNGMDNF